MSETETETTPRRRGRPAKAKPEPNEVEQDFELVEATPADMGFEDEKCDVLPPPEKVGADLPPVLEPKFPAHAVLLPAQHDTDPWGDTPAQMRGE